MSIFWCICWSSGGVKRVGEGESCGGRQRQRQRQRASCSLLLFSSLMFRVVSPLSLGGVNEP